MIAHEDPIIVTSTVCRRCKAVSTTQVYHRDYPEARAEGDSPALAAARLVERLSLGLDSVPDRWRSDPVRAAIADVRAFLARGDEQG